MDKRSPVAFDWSSVGSAPTVDEFEIAFFGPGFGECIVMHVGSGRWVIVDSCVDAADASDRRPVAEKYLRALGVDIGQSVDLIVATHWHADHVRGIGRLVGLCREADFSCAVAMAQPEFIVYIEEMHTGAMSTDGAKVGDFREAIRHIYDRGKPIRWASGSRLLRTWDSTVRTGEKSCHIRALSPSDREYEMFLQEVATARPTHAKPKRAAAARSPNLASVVLHVQHEALSIVLGADMETHHNPLRGWTAAIGEAQISGMPPADLLKIPHHGSETGHHEGIWSHLLVQQPVAVVTPFNKLPEARKLPTALDIERLSALTRELIATAPTRSLAARGRETSVERSFKESGIVIRSSASPLGLIRLRKREAQEMSIQLFPPALFLHRQGRSPE